MLGALPVAHETALIGREEQVAFLRAAVDGAVQRQAKVVAVLGEAGVGKTRLLSELAILASALGVRVLSSGSYETEQILPLGLWVNVLRSGRVVDDGEAVASLPPVWRAELARLLPELASPGQAPPGAAADHRPLFESVTELIRRMAARQPLLMILDDLTGRTS